MVDGITLVNLVEIAANSEIPFIDRNPLSAAARRSNIEKAISFLNSDGANLSPECIKDIFDGSMKGVMRVILAIAEKYNPRSVRPITTGPPPPIPPRPSISSSSSFYSQDNPSSSHHSTPDRLRSIDQQHSPRATSPLTNLQVNNIPQTFALSQQGYGPSSQGFISQGVGQGGMGYSLSQPTPQPPDGIYSTPIDSLPNHITQKITSQMPPSRVIAPKPIRHSSSKPNVPPGLIKPIPVPPKTVSVSPKNVPEDNKDVGKVEVVEPEDPLPPPPLPDYDHVGEIGGVITQLNEFKSELLQLHSVLLDNNKKDNNDSHVIKDVDTFHLDLRLTEKDKEIEELIDKLKKAEEQCKKLETDCENLRGLVLDRNQFITSMKSEIYRKEYRNDTEKVDLQTQLLHKEKTLKVLEAEVSMLKASVEGKDREVVDMREKIRQHEKMEIELREELDRVTLDLTRAANAEECLQVKLNGRDKKILSLEEKLEERGGQFDISVISDDIDGIRKNLEIFKSNLDQSDPHQTLLETLEKSISDMLTRISNDHSRSLSPGRRPRRHGYAQHEDRKGRRHKERSISKEEVPHAVTNPTVWTKVFYYMTGDKSETPYVTTVPRKANEVRLKDFKAVFDRHGSYR
jgi:hypothetical protein